MPTITEVRQKYPQYDDLSDDQLAGALHKKFYSDMPADEFRTKIGMTPPPELAAPVPAAEPASIADVSKGVGAGLLQGGAYVAGLPGDLLSAVDAGVRNIPRLFGAPAATMPERTGIGKMAQAIEPPTSEQTTASMVKNITGPLYEPKSTLGKYGKTFGEMLPQALAGPGRAAAMPFQQAARQAARRVMPTVVAPAVASEAAGQATEGTAAEPYARFAGALAGGVVPSAARRLRTPNPIDPGRQRAVQILEREGVQPTAGQATGRKRLQYAESELGGGGTAGMLERQGDQFTAAVLRRVGENTATRATTDVVDNAFTRLGSEFDQVARNNVLTPDPELLRDMSRAWTHYSNVVGPSARAPIVQDTMTDIVALTRNPRIAGNVYQRRRSQIDRAARTTTDSDLKTTLYDLRNALDDAMERSMTRAGRAPDVVRWQQARRQYGNLMVVQKALAGGGEQAGLGIISPARLRMAAASGPGRRNFLRGRSDFSDLAMAGNAVLTPLPNSGTASRLTASGLTTALGAIGGGAVGDWPSAVGGAIAGAAVPAVAGLYSDVPTGARLSAQPGHAAVNSSKATGRTYDAVAGASFGPTRPAGRGRARASNPALGSHDRRGLAAGRVEFSGEGVEDGRVVIIAQDDLSAAADLCPLLGLGEFSIGAVTSFDKPPLHGVHALLAVIGSFK